MSRIIITRHPNGEERLVTGWDRPLNTAFVDLYDDEGECMHTAGPMSGQTLDAQGALTAIGMMALNGYGTGLEMTDSDTPRVVGALLLEHRGLDFPESNIEVDLTQEG